MKLFANNFGMLRKAVWVGMLLAWTLPLCAASTSCLWEIGKPDGANTEFALAPNGYGKFKEDGFFIVGKSDPKKDWPYVQPGPEDGWGGGRPHSFSIMFGLSALAKGECQLQVRLLDTQGRIPPELNIEVNGTSFKKPMPPGATDDSVYGQPAKGKKHAFEIRFPSDLLRVGGNEITITTLRGSWILYDWLGLNVPAGFKLAETTGTFVSAFNSPPVLVEKAGKLMQPVQLTIKSIGQAGEVLLRARKGNENHELAVTLSNAIQTVNMAIPAVQQESVYQVSVMKQGRQLISRELTLQPVRKWVVYLLPHSHVDIGYTHVQTDVEKAQWKYLEMAMDTARKTANNPPGSRFKWNVEVLWAVDSYLRQATPEKQQQFIDAVKAGQVGLQALYGNQLTGLCRDEELMRLVGFAQTLGQRCGKPIESAMITDVPGYTWGMVPTFVHSGVKYFSIGPNGGDRIGHTIAAWGDKPFWWIGPNGRDKVLVWMTGTGYYQVFQSPEKLLGYLRQLDDKNYPYDMVQVRHCLGDNGAPDVNFADKVNAWNSTHAYPKLVIATSEEMFHDFEKRYAGKIPSAQGDFTPYWEDGAASSARETALNRASADRLLQAETTYALFNPKAYPAEKFYQAWRNVLLYDEHTWGAHNSISQPDHSFVKSQWAIKQAFALDADRQSRELLESGLSSHGEPVKSASASENIIDVVNPYALSDAYCLVSIPKELSTPGDVVTLDASTTPLRSQRLTTGELVCRPCFNRYSTGRLHIKPGQPPAMTGEAATAEGNMLSSGKPGQGLQLRVDEKTGGIISLLYKVQELVNTNAGMLNEYFYLPGTDLNGVQQNGPVKISVKERGPLIASLLVESDAPGCRKLTREIRVHALQHYVEIINTIDKLPIRAKEGVHIGFPFQVPYGRIRMDIPWAVMRPEVDQIPGACKNWFSVQRWLDISNDKYGATLVTPDAPLFQIGTITANLLGALSDTRNWLEQTQDSQSVYAWVMNNHWHTNYRAEQEGPTVFRFFIIPHGPYDATTVARLSLEASQPLLVTPARGEAKLSSLAVQARKITSRPSNVIISGFKPSDDGKAWIIRFQEIAGKRTSFTLPDAETKALWLSDNSEHPLEQTSNRIEIPALSLLTIRADLKD